MRSLRLPFAAALLMSIFLLAGCSTFREPVVIPEPTAAVSADAVVYLVLPHRSVGAEIPQQYAGGGYVATGYGRGADVIGNIGASVIASIVDGVKLRNAARRADLVRAAARDLDFRRDYFKALSDSRLPASGIRVAWERILTKTPTAADFKRIREQHAGKPVLFIGAAHSFRPEMSRLAVATIFAYFDGTGEEPTFQSVIRYESAAPAVSCDSTVDWRQYGANWQANQARLFRRAYRQGIASSINVLESALLDRRDWREFPAASVFRSLFDMDINRMHHLKGIVTEESSAHTVILEESGDYYVYGRGETGYEALAKRIPLAKGKGRLVYYRTVDEPRAPFYLRAGEQTSVPICNGFFTYLDLPPGEYPLRTHTDGGLLAGQWVSDKLGSVKIVAGQTVFARVGFAPDSWGDPVLQTATDARAARGLMQAQAHSSLLGGEPAPFDETAPNQLAALPPLPPEPVISDSRSFFAGIPERDLPAAMERAVTDFVAAFSEARASSALDFYAPEYRRGDEDYEAMSRHWMFPEESPFGKEVEVKPQVRILKIERDGFDPIVSYTATGLTHQRAERVRLVYRGARWLWYGDSKR